MKRIEFNSRKIKWSDIIVEARYGSRQGKIYFSPKRKPVVCERIQSQKTRPGRSSGSAKEARSYVTQRARLNMWTESFFDITDLIEARREAEEASRCQERVLGQHESRNSHAHERDHRNDGTGPVHRSDQSSSGTIWRW